MRIKNGTRPKAEIIENLNAFGFLADVDLYDKGYDFFLFFGGTIKGQVIPFLLASPHLETFKVTDKKARVIATQDSVELNEEPWYKALLEAIYKPSEAKS